MIAFWYGLILCCLAQLISVKLNRLEILECNYQDNILALFNHYLRQCVTEKGEVVKVETHIRIPVMSSIACIYAFCKHTHPLLTVR